MSRRLLVILVALGVLATGGGVAGGLLLAGDPGGDPVVAGPTTIPETTAPPTTEPASSSSSSTGSSTTTSTTGALSVQARVVQRLEDGVVVRYDTQEPVSATLVWGFGGPSGHELRFPGPATQGTLKLVLARTTNQISMRVTGQAADGRTGTSDTLVARRLVRRVVLEVVSLTLDIPTGTGGIATGFRGTTFRPIGPGRPGPSASAQPYAFPSAVLGAGERSGPLALRFFSQLPPAPTRTRVVNLTVSFPRSGQATLNRDVTALGLTAHLRLRVTVTAA
ncbi:MAG TPA: hypothetical protein VJ966_19570 [Actinomycetes bacterium]|nr:hypothetical protein [Actinomycetes bacterium]